MMEWIDQQTESLKTWLRGSAIPMIVTLIDGSIIWANASFSNLIGYSLPEIFSKTITWHDLTVVRKDIEANITMAEKVKHGEIIEYKITENYMTKRNSLVPVTLHVLRYPLRGDFQCFLVTVIPLESAEKLAIEELGHMKEILLKFIEATELENNNFLTKIGKWVQNNPKFSMLMFWAIAFLLFGDRVAAVVKAIQNAISP